VITTAAAHISGADLFERWLMLSFLGGIILLVIGVLMVWVAKPSKEGVSPAFFRGIFMVELWPVACLLVMVLGVAGILKSFV
jgi:hypothetical protein